jgi:hypothetical protein
LREVVIRKTSRLILQVMSPDEKDTRISPLEFTGIRGTILASYPLALSPVADR